jgi:putative ABC transport system permease protein
MKSRGPSLKLVLKIGFKSLLLHKVRSILAGLGIVIGTAAVIALLTLGAGSRKEALDAIKALGATNIIVASVKPPQDSSDATRQARILKYGVTWEDYERFASIPTVWRALPIRAFGAEIWYLDHKFDGRVVGTTPRYAEMNRLRLASGRFLTDRDDANYDNVVVLGHDVARELFGYEDPLSKAVRIGMHYYVVVGVMAYRVPSAGVGGSLAREDYNKDVYIPLSTCRARFGDYIVERRSGQFTAEDLQLSQVTLSVRETHDVRPTAAILKELLQRYHTKPDYQITVPLDLLEDAERTALLWAVFLGVVAGISLLVGGIGIANIMLATVMERTREIGIRRAIGAKRRHIAQQFLVEAMILTGVGGMLGLVVGLAAPELIKWVAATLFDYTVRTQVLWWSLPMAPIIAILVGVLSGLYPARRAALMDPIEALRYE